MSTHEMPTSRLPMMAHADPTRHASVIKHLELQASVLCQAFRGYREAKLLITGAQECRD
jgi:hypothetical protein